MREGRVAEALPYFPADSDPRFASGGYDDDAWKIQESDVRQRAARYGDALRTAGSAWGRTARAQAWYQAATLARRDGIRIMGYEQARTTPSMTATIQPARVATPTRGGAKPAPTPACRWIPRCSAPRPTCRAPM
ncbi:hypothetical protein WJ969_26070 [Achromobacter xylosoxidans]